MSKFVIMTNPRTGSEYVVRLLNQHPEVNCHGEIFAIPPGDGEWNDSVYKKEDRPLDYLEYRRMQSDKRIFGYKQISYWLNNTGYHDIRDFIFDSLQRNYRFILMTRRNLLKEFTSFMIMMEHKYGHIQKDGQVKRQIRLNPRFTYMTLRKWQAFNEQCEEVLSELGADYVKLVYEDDFKGDKPVKNKVFEFLGVEPIQLDDPLRPTNPYQLNDLIINYDEVMELLRIKRRDGFILEEMS
jgi:LPS sulfotransferase NodH